MSGCTRRRFLEDTALAAAVMAAFPAAEVLAADDKKKKKESGAKAVQKVKDPLRVAIIGVGSRGSEHIAQWLAEPRVEIAYVVDADSVVGQKKAEAIAKKQGKAPQVAQDMRKAFDDPSVQIVSTATPNHWHALTAIWAMQAGKDVYVEKPAAYNVMEGRSMVATARATKRLCQVGTQCRSMQGTIDAIDYVHSGKIGQVKLARGLCYKRRKSIGPKGEYQVPAEVDYNLWCGPARTLPLTRPKFHYDWHWQREWGNGDMGNQGPHQMDIIRWGMNLNRLCDRAIAYGGRLGYDDAGDVANTEVALFEFGDKTLVFEVRGLETDPLRGASVGAIFYGSDGYVVLTSYEGGAAFDPQGNLVTKFKGRGEHFSNFVDAVLARDGSKLHAEVLEGHLSCAHSHLANISYYLGQPAAPEEIQSALAAWKTNEDTADCLARTLAHLAKNQVDLKATPLTLGPVLTVDSQQQTVVGNPAAAALLTREYRAPFVVPKPETI